MTLQNLRWSDLACLTTLHSSPLNGRALSLFRTLLVNMVSSGRSTRRGITLERCNSAHTARFTTIEDAKKMCPGLVVQHVATYREGEAEAGYWDEVDPLTHKVSRLGILEGWLLSRSYRSAWIRIVGRVSRSWRFSRRWSREAR